MVDTEDEAQIVGTQPPKKPSHSSHTSNPSHQHSKPGPTTAGREGEEGEEEDPDEEEEGAVNSIIHRRERRHFPHRHAQIARDLDKDWGRDHTRENMRQDTRKGLEEPQPRVLQPEMDSVVRGRSLSWIRTGPAELGPGRKGGGTDDGGGGEMEAETLPKLSKSSLLFPQKSSLSALASRAKQILSNSAHSNNPNDNNNKLAGNNKEKREENKIYITRPRSAKEREKDREREQRRERREERASRRPREVFPGVFLYQTGKTTRLVNLGAKGHTGGGITGGRSLVSAPQLWPNPPTKEGKTSPHNGSINIQNESVQKSAYRAAGAKSKRKGEHRDIKTTVTADLPSKGDPLTPLSHHKVPSPPQVTLPRFNSTENTLQGQSRVTSYLRTSEITESQQHPDLDLDPNPVELDQNTNRSSPDPDPDPEPEPEEGEMSDYSYEEVEARPGWAEESINWQRTFSVNPMDFELLRSDWNDLRCNVSGNLQLAESEVVDVLAQYMEKLNERNAG